VLIVLPSVGDISVILIHSTPVIFQVIRCGAVTVPTILYDVQLVHVVDVPEVHICKLHDIFWRVTFFSV